VALALPRLTLPQLHVAEALAVRLLAAPLATPETGPGDGAPAATATEEAVSGHARGLPAVDVRRLAHAVDTGQAVTIAYVAASGNRTVRTLGDLDLDPPHLHAWCHLHDDERVFTLSRIQAVMPA
jgi:predicted DNA-binding transcriptional regulator YafY